ncbi:Starch-binding domain-containing protein 1 [Liparis tanakae]|uniref:Starch-binding domain-containing protein 1 n=1 Tax=Liparis tanakae TaxID=230148 RepID=A0A4Z2ILL0_9TELE|nr:Starch-binding domain-containing protein 1 [Liparis tanakae]
MSDYGLRDETTNGVGSHSEEPAGHVEDVSVPWLYDGKDEEFEREGTDGNTRLSPEGESRNESEEAEEHRLDHLLIGQLAEVQSSTFQRNSNRPSVTDEAAPPVWYSDCDEDGGPAGEGVVREDHLNNLDAPWAQFAERAVEMELDGGNGSEERDCLSVALSPALDCWSAPVKADNLDGGLPATVGIAEADDLSLDRQPLQEEDDELPSLDTNYIFLQGDVNALLAEERVDQWPSQDWQSDPTKTDNADFSEVATGAAPVAIEVLNPRLRQVDLPSLEQFALMDYDVSCVGEESGISSMTVTPDAGNEYDVIFGNMAVPLVHSDLKCEGQTEAQSSLFADDEDISVIEEDSAGMVLGPRPSKLSRPPRSERAAWTIYESFASSQDTFGHEIEDSYHRAVDHFAAQIKGSVTCFTEKHSEASVVVRTKEKKGASVDMKEATTSAKEKEEDYEKTEISIMEATMDHNEWIMDGNCQAFPWMNLSATDDTKSNPLPSEECQDLHAEVQQGDALSLVYENVKSVVVQPTARNVDVTFSVHYVTQSPYQTVGVMGNQQALGNWKGFVPLENTVDGHWAAVVSLPAESHVEWKFVVVDKGEVCRWEECGNRLLDTGYGDELLVQKCWARL